MAVGRPRTGYAVVRAVVSRPDHRAAPCVIDRLCGGRGEQAFAQVCGRQEQSQRRFLFRPLHAARRLASLYVHAHRHGSRTEGIAVRNDARRAVRATQWPSQGRCGTHRKIPARMITIASHLLRTGRRWPRRFRADKIGTNMSAPRGGASRPASGVTGVET